MRSLLLVLVLLVLAPDARGETVLLMLDEKGCQWCKRWDAEVGVVYSATREGRQAPLLRQDIRQPLPQGVALARAAHYTPTFVLLNDGIEIGRIEGYPGEDFFYGLLGKILQKAAVQPKDGA